MTTEQYSIAKTRIAEYDVARAIYCRDNKTNGVPVEVCATFPNASLVDNNLRSEVEIYEFMNDKPTNYFLYINETMGRAVTWTGACLGRVHFGKEYRDNFGGKRQPITVIGINGVKYHGTYYKSSGDYARIKAFKYQ